MNDLGKGSLPEGWRWVRLGIVCTQDRQIIEPGTATSANRPYLSLEHIESNTGRILRESAGPTEDEGKSTTFAFDGRHILYGKLRPYLNKVALPDFQGRCTTELIPLLPTNTERALLAWALRRQETVDAAMSGKTGSRMPRANMDELLCLEIPLPPLSEQKRIAAILNEQIAAVEGARAAAEAQLEAAKGLPAAYLRAVFNSPEAQEWPKKRLRDVAKLERGKFTPRPRNDPRYYGGPYPWIQTGEVESAKKYITSYKNTLNEQGLSVSKVFPKGTLVITIAATIGAVGILSFDSCMPDSLVGITPKEGVSETEYLYYLLVFARDHLESIAPQMAQANLKLGLLEPLEIPLPPLSEQQRIVAVLNEQVVAAERTRKALEEQLDTMNKLPAALLRRAFSGEL